MELRLVADNGAHVFFDGVRLKIPSLVGKYDFTGKKEDEGTGLLYFGARYYDPEVGRYVSQDPAKDGGNWFGYCENNPLKNYDPNGLASECALVGPDQKVSTEFHKSYKGGTLGIAKGRNGSNPGIICPTASGLSVYVDGTMTVSVYGNTAYVDLNMALEAFATNAAMGLTISVSVTISVYDDNGKANGSRGSLVSRSDPVHVGTFSMKEGTWVFGQMQTLFDGRISFVIDNLPIEAPMDIQPDTLAFVATISFTIYSPTGQAITVTTISELTTVYADEPGGNGT